MKKLTIFALSLLIILIIAASIYVYNSKSNKYQNSENYCIKLAQNFESLEKEGNYNPNLGLGGILVDYFWQKNVAGHDFYWMHIKPINEKFILKLYVNRSEFDYSRGKFYTFNLTDTGHIAKPMVEVGACSKDQNYIHFRKSQPNYTEDYFCYQDSDCIIKDNGVNCPIASHKDDTSKYEISIPPSNTVCPKVDEIVAFCSQEKCRIKYDCSKCDILKKEFGGYCPTYTGGTFSWVCGMYNECNC